MDQGTSTILMLVVLFALMYFLMIRPENKRKKQAQEMRDSLKKGDVITTIGGVVGKIVSVNNDTIVIETSEDRVRIEFTKWAVSNVGVQTGEQPSKDSKDSKKKEAAMKFIEFMTTGEGQQEWINTLQGAPVDKDMKVEVSSDATESAKASIDLVTKGQASSKLERKLTSQELNDEIGVQMQNIYTGDATVDSALKAIQQVNESIER